MNLQNETFRLQNKENITETIRLHRLRLFGHVERMEENRIPKRVLYMNLEKNKTKRQTKK